MQKVRLGYEVGGGDEVQIPVQHMIVCGMTQRAGKTTALNGLIARSGLKALTFITKRGEQAFPAAAHRLDPYFRDAGDWQFVASILEASRGERLKFERAWIIRASRGARSLVDVHRNVRKALATAKTESLSENVYLALDAYLDVVVPMLARVQWAPSVALRDGLNVVDLSDLPLELHHLIIKSSLDYVLQFKTDTIVVIPEVWQYAPEGRNTPVKLAAETFARQGAALGNFLWLDSQDLGGVAKSLLRNVSVWLLGVQREANEIKRTLDNIPRSTSKPGPSDMMALDLGQFYACWGRHIVKVYAQPAGMSSAVARATACGEETVSQARLMTPAAAKTALTTALQLPADAMPPGVLNEGTVTETEARLLESENAALRSRIAALEHTIESMRAERGVGGGGSPDAMRTWVGGSPGGVGGQAFVLSGAAKGGEDALSDDLYRAILDRLRREDPKTLMLTIQRPELVVDIEAKVIAIDADSVKGRIAKLIADGWFATGRTVGAVRHELARTGTDPGSGGGLGLRLAELKSDGFLVRQGDSYLVAPGATVLKRERAVRGAA